MPVAVPYTPLTLFNLIIQHTPRSAYRYLSLTNEQVGRPGRLKGFPKAQWSCQRGALNPDLSLNGVLYHAALFVRISYVAATKWDIKMNRPHIPALQLLPEEQWAR